MPDRSRRGRWWLRRVVLRTAVPVAAGAVAVGPLRAAVQAPTGSSHSARAGITDTVLAFRDVTVIDVASGRRLAGQTVVVVGSRIRAVGPVGQVAVPPGAQVVEAKGKYVVPGFWDMHAHITGNVEVFDSITDVYPMFIAHGVTGIREMAQRFDGGSDSFRVWQREIAARARVGPRAVGPSADVTEGSGIAIDTTNVRRILDSLKAAGDAFVKYHGRPDDRKTFFALAREARRVGLPLVGHTPRSGAVTEIEVADSGMRSVEHINEHRQCWLNWPQPLGDSAEVDARCAPIAQAYIRNGTWLTPTLVVHLLPVFEDVDFAEVLRYLRVMRRLGVTQFLAGSDWAPDLMDSDPRFQPGLAAVEELVLLVQAGLTPLEALQAGTLNPAKFFEATDSLGTVAPGKLADLVLLDGDPLSNIRNVLQLRAVVANGRYFDRAALDRLHLPGTGLLEAVSTRTGANAAP